ncbi:heavy-metal-associated domain-containing protein [Curtanaerobium respiraculi]|uniref:heavy-metal-associated domain-containing protein n=1 Tax=Curtanaerobium respiraculi TaxID=2949669 RepID=UPI0024B37921|nr:heavy metal-associated domain-containing protein [Curtanaerobium respiraculi]
MYRTTANIDGMMCGMCENHIQDAIRCDFNVKASRGKKTAVIVSEEPITEEALHVTIDSTGYGLLSVSSEL